MWQNAVEQRLILAHWRRMELLVVRDATMGVGKLRNVEKLAMLSFQFVYVQENG